MISFGGGYPNPETFPFLSMDLFLKGGKWLKIDGSQMTPALQYGPSDANPNLKERLRAWHNYKDNIALSEDALVVLNGAQEGLFIAAYLFLEKGDTVVVSEPTYPGALSAFGAFSDHFIAIPLDQHGMNTEVLAQSLQRLEANGHALPKLIYTIPSGHNPGGVTLSRERRLHLLDLAREYDLLILEDDPYQLVRLEEGGRLPTLQSLDREDRVIRLDSFSKIFAPGLRLGYASGSPEVIRHFVLFKQSANLHTSTLPQAILAAYLASYGPEVFKAEIKEKCLLYRANRDEMVDAARAHLPEGVKYNIPGEGLFIWFELPEGCNGARMIEQRSRELKVLLVPGSAFSSQGGCAHCMRASYSMVSKERIREGMQRFARMIQREQDRRA
jgi:2-aminoadipate transaminase